MIEISPLNMAFASSLLLVVGVLSLVLELGINRQLAVAAVRTVAQLALLGLVLEWVFQADSALVVVALLVSMIINASLASVRRTTRRFQGIWLSGLVAVTLSTVFTTAVAMSLVVEVRPWYEARYIIPLVGMILGNSLTGLSLCVESLMADIDEKQDNIEEALSVGAHIGEALRPYLQKALRTGLTPIINSMTVVGIVSIPGMLTGQVLAGASPAHAVRYQIIIMFMIAGATALSASFSTQLVARHLVTKRHQVAAHKLRKVS